MLIISQNLFIRNIRSFNLNIVYSCFNLMFF